MFTMADVSNAWFLLTQCHTTEKALYRDIRNEAEVNKEKTAEYIDKIVNTESTETTSNDTTSSSATTTSKAEDVKNMKDFAKMAEKISAMASTTFTAQAAAKAAEKGKKSTNKIIDFPKLEGKTIDTIVDENGFAVPVNDQTDENDNSTTDIDVVFPKLISDDQYKDILTKEEIKYSALPWFISQGVSSGILYSAGKVGLNQMLGQIEESTMNHPETAMQFQMDGLKTTMQDVINAITSTFSNGKPFTGLPRMRVEDVCSKDYLNNIATDVFELADHDRSVKRILKRIRKYQYKKVETNPKKPIDPVIQNRNTVNNEPNNVTFKKIDEAFGSLLGKHHTYAAFGNYVGMYIDGVIDMNGQPHPFLIDPNMIIGNGYCLLATASTTGTCLINIAEHRDIVKKIIENYNYILTDDEYKNIKKGQFINEELYAILDMSGMSDNIKSMSDKDMKLLEDKLNHIFGIKNPVFIGLQFIPRFRFSIFKSINEFTLVSDSKVKTQCEQLKQTVYPIMPDNDTVAITVSEHNYVLTYRGSNVTMPF